MPDVWFAVPGDVRALTGGYAYARRLMQALPQAGWTPRHLVLPASFPLPSADDLAQTRDLFAKLPARAVVLADGLAFGVLPPTLLARLELSWVALVHHPLAHETGLSDAVARRFRDSERAALGAARSVIATSPHTVEVLQSEFGVPRARIFLAPPGTDAAARVQNANQVPRLLTVATLTHRKAHDVLIHALAQLRDVPWTSLLVGSLERDPAVTAKVRGLIKTHGLEDRITLRGELRDSALEAAYAEADVFVLPSRHEGYGMVFAEALARGLPIIACAAGAVTETVPADAGLLVAPDDPTALAQALRQVLCEQGLRQRLSDAAWIHGQRLPRWADTAAQVAAALRAASP